MKTPPSSNPRTENKSRLFFGGGEMGERIRELDWSKTPLGPVESWPQSLCTAVNIMLASRFPMMIHWGPELVHFYNDGYIPILQTKHPGALGAPAKPWWEEMWEFLLAIFNPVLEGETTYFEDQLVLPQRRGFIEECYFTFSHNPIQDENGKIGGIFVTAIETTGHVVSQRRMALLSDMAKRTVQAENRKNACLNILRSLETNPHDISFALLYLTEKEGKAAKLAGFAGVEPGMQACTARVPLEAEESLDAGWPFAKVARSGKGELVLNLEERFGILPGGPWPESTRQAAVFPIHKAGQEEGAGLPYGFIVMGISPRRYYDEEYQSFFNLVSEQVAKAIAAATAYQEEKRRAEALAEIDKAKTIFFSNISHEFRTPLTLMLGPVDKLLMQEVPEQVKEQLKLIRRNGQRLLKLVSTLLDFSRIEAGRMQASFSPLELARVTEGLSSAFRSAVEQAGLELVIDCASLTRPVYVDRQMWEHILFNLLSNALKFTFEGRIAVSLREREEAVELKVSDTGTGISAENLPHIFSRFHRIEGVRSRTYEGSGIGLALVQELVKLHGGKVEVISTPGEGSVFTVLIPFGKNHLPVEQVEENLSWEPQRMLDFTSQAENLLERNTEASLFTPKRLPENVGSGTILIADDNADMREYLQDILQETYEVQLSANGEEAWDIIKRTSPDLVISDIMMPLMDGLQLLKRIRSDEQTKRIPIILLSARAGEESRVEGIESGADIYLTKPFSARELISTVKVQLEMARLRSAYEKVIDGLSDGFVTLDKTMNILFVNRAVQSLLGIGKEELVGRSLLPAIPFALETDLQDQLLKTLEEGKSRKVELHTEEGKWWEVRIYPSESNVSFFICNITHRKKVEDGLQKSIEEVNSRNLELMRVNEVLDNFVHIAAHDLKSPVGNMKIILDLMKQSSDVAEREKFMDMIFKSVHQLDKTLVGLLSMLELQSHGKDEMKSIRFPDIFEIIRFELEGTLVVQKGQLTADFSAEEEIVYVEAYLLSIMRNLVHNAIKYRSEDRPPEIHVYTRRLPGMVMLAVQDNGMGMDLKENAQNLFKAFKRFTKKAEGKGLGLHLVKNMVERNGGKIEVESELDKGTTFKCFLKEYVS